MTKTAGAGAAMSFVSPTLADCPYEFPPWRRPTSREQVSHRRSIAAVPPMRGELTYHESTQRRDLFWLGGQAAISAFTAGAIGSGELFAQRKPQLPPDSLEQRVAQLCWRYSMPKETTVPGRKWTMRPPSGSRMRRTWLEQRSPLSRSR